MAWRSRPWRMSVAMARAGAEARRLSPRRRPRARRTGAFTGAGRWASARSAGRRRSIGRPERSASGTACRFSATLQRRRTGRLVSRSTICRRSRSGSSRDTGSRDAEGSELRSSSVRSLPRTVPLAAGLKRLSAVAECQHMPQPVTPSIHHARQLHVEPATSQRRARKSVCQRRTHTKR